MITESRGSHGIAAAIRDAARMQAVPTKEMTEGLNLALRAGFLDTQANAHVLTGRLKASGEMSSRTEPDGAWIGHIEYGGPGVEQALYEMARGGEHDWMRNMPEFEQAMEEVIERGIRRVVRG